MSRKIIFYSTIIILAVINIVLDMNLNRELQELTNDTDIDLILPGKEPCIYYVISSDIDSSRDFLVSLFFYISIY